MEYLHGDTLCSPAATHMSSHHRRASHFHVQAYSLRQAFIVLTNSVIQIETEEDELWGPDFREEKEQIKARGLRFMKWLMTRPESRIAVVSHSSFLFFTMANFGLHASTLVQVKIPKPLHFLATSRMIPLQHVKCGALHSELQQTHMLAQKMSWLTAPVFMRCTAP